MAVENMPVNSRKDFIVRIPARFLKDASISSDAKALRTVIASYADGKTGWTYVTGRKLEQTLRWGRHRRERAQTELHKAGWLHLAWKRGTRGKFARRIYRLTDPRLTIVQFERSGKTDLLIIDHSQSQVKSSIPTDLTDSKYANPENSMERMT